MNDEQLILCAALCGLAAFLGYKLGQQQRAAVQARQDAPADSTAWLMAGGWVA